MMPKERVFAMVVALMGVPGCGRGMKQMIMILN